MGTPGPTKHGIRNLHDVTAIKALLKSFLGAASHPGCSFSDKCDVPNVIFHF